MSYGIIHLRSRARKVARAHHRATMKGSPRPRVVGVKVFVQRGLHPTSTSEGGGYWAWACTMKPERSGERREAGSLAEHRRKACGEDAHGKTPTAAIKKALINLGRKRDLR